MNAFLAMGMQSIVAASGAPVISNAGGDTNVPVLRLEIQPLG